MKTQHYRYLGTIIQFITTQNQRESIFLVGSEWSNAGRDNGKWHQMHKNGGVKSICAGFRVYIKEYPVLQISTSLYS